MTVVPPSARMTVTGDERYSFFLTLMLTFLYGLKYSIVYPVTSHANPASRAAMIHLTMANMAYSFCRKCGFICLNT